MRILIASPVIAFHGVSHAGGEFLLRHIQALNTDHQVTLIVPRNTLFPQDEAMLHLAPCTTYMIDNNPLSGNKLNIIGHATAVMHPTSIFSSFWADALKHPGASEALDKADAVELQWFEMALTARTLRRMGYDKSIFGFYHDVMSQRMGREFRAETRLPHRVVKAARTLIVRQSERTTIKHLSLNVCLNEKDSRLLASIGAPDCKLLVVNPPLDDDEMPVQVPDLTERDPVAIFVAQFGRKENDQAARWILKNVWPDVRAENDSFQLVFAGGGLSEDLRDLIKSTPGTSATGYIPSLNSAYLSARAAVVPLLSGAGIKFKSIIPMLWGVPVIATTVGAEGLNPTLFAAIEDDASVFAKKMIAALKTPSSYDTLRKNALNESRSTYSRSAYLKVIRRIYAKKYA